MSLPASRGLLVPGPTSVLEPNGQRNVLRFYLHRASERQTITWSIPFYRVAVLIPKLGQEKAIKYTAESCYAGLLDLVRSFIDPERWQGDE